MRYFLDTEFNGFGGELVAIALVPETEEAPPFYEAVDCAAPVAWISAHVLPVLRTKQRPLIVVARLFAEYLATDATPIVIADWPEDIAHAASLLTNGQGERLLHTSVRFELLQVSDFGSEARSEVPHNAYYDALALRDWALSQSTS
jgi:hypothetical protein